MGKASPRGENGRFLPVLCNDPRCEGSLTLDSFYGRDIWRCDGLTHDSDLAPLRACTRQFYAYALPSQHRLPEAE